MKQHVVVDHRMSAVLAVLLPTVFSFAISAQVAAAVDDALSSPVPAMAWAGFALSDDGGRAGSAEVAFYVGGERLNVSATAGLTAVALTDDLAALESSVSLGDAAVGAAEAFASFMNGLPQGTAVLVAGSPSDGSWPPTVLSALKDVGGARAADADHTDVYALLGRKGEALPLSENLVVAGDAAAVAASAFGPHGYPGVVIEVSSSGYVDGNAAILKLGGKLVAATMGRGFNTVFLGLDGFLLGARNFDTYKGEAADMARAINGLPNGTVVLVAVQDDASIVHAGDRPGGERAAAALAACGARRIGDVLLRRRSSYAFIGVKGAAALAEVMLHAGEGPAIVNARYGGPLGAFDQYRPTTTVTTTTAPVAMCAEFECPEDQMHRANVWNTEGHDAGTCCEAQETGVVSVAVRSAGYGNGNLAEFHINGKLVQAIARRGINVLPLRSDGTPRKVHSFDTFKTGSADLAEFVAGIADGTRVLVASRDEATRHLTDNARAAVETLGGVQIWNLTYRGAYALIGEKGGKASAEQVLPDGGGVAVASAQFQVTAQQATGKPRCDGRSADPPVSGWVSNGQFELDEGCRYPLFDEVGAAQCMAGSWMVVIGGSNTVLMAIRLANMLATDAILPVRDGATMGGFTLVDVVIREKAVVYRAAGKVEGCSALPHSLDCKAAIADRVAAAVPPLAGDVRITLISAQFWDHAQDGLDVVQAKGADWLSTKMSFLVQVSTWDIYCAGMRVSWCPRPALADEEQTSDAAALQLFRDGMIPVLDGLLKMCGPGGPAAEHGCVVATTTFQNPSPTRVPIYEAYNDLIRDGMAGRKSTSLRLLDLWVMGQAMPAENILGHGSPMLNLWNWQVMLAGMCPTDDIAQGTKAVFVGELCTGDQARRNYRNDEIGDKCPDYRDKCKDTPRCEPWECANSETCSLVPTRSGPARDMQGACSDETISLSDNLSQVDAEDAPLCHKALWCAPGMEWLPALAAVSLAALLLLATSSAVTARLPWGKKVSPKAGCAGVSSLVVPAPSDVQLQHPDVKPAETSSLASPCPTPPATPPTTAASSSSECEIQTSPAPSQATPDGDGPGLVLTEVKDKTEGVPLGVKNDLEGGGNAGSTGAGEDCGAQGKSLQATACRETTRRLAGDRFPLGLARFCASLHVVVGHLYAKGVTSPVYMFGWGFTWVPWFFMLSGFVLFTANLRRPKQEGILDYAVRRSVSIYPLYAFSLLPSVALAWWAGNLPSVKVLVAQSFLLQAWWPEWTEQALQSHCWFLSAMVVYWLLFQPMACALKRLGLAATVTLMLALFFLPWLVIIAPALADEPVAWYKQHSWGKTDTPMDLFVVFLKFNPLCYLHVFVLGMLLARVRLLLDAQAVVSAGQWKFRWPVEAMAPLGYIGLVLVFCVPAIKPLAFKLSARLSVLLPLQAMVLLGLAGLPSMPIGYFADFASKLNFLENYSYGVYVFQFVCYSVWPEHQKVNLPLFLAFCTATSVVVNFLVQRHIQGWWTRHARARIAVPFVMAAILVGFTLAPSSEASNLSRDLPAMIRLMPDMVDVRLPLLERKGAQAPVEPGVLMNPSAVVVGDQIVLSARSHRLEVTRHNGWYHGEADTVEEQTWYSQVLFGSAALNDEAWAAWPSTGVAPFSGSVSVTPWHWLRTAEGSRWRHLCVPERYIPANRTLVRHVVTGPEDAKMFTDGDGSLAVSFNSLPPLGEEGCAAGEDVSQMYIAGNVSIDGDTEDVGRKLQCGAADVAEKNWIPFAAGDNQQLHFVYSPSPHKVVTAGPDGSCQEAYSTDFGPLQRLQRDNPHLDVRGSGQAALVDDAEATPSLPRRHFLAALHVFDRRNKTYSHFAYRFSDQPPFNVLQVSEQLSLVEARSADSPQVFAFVSGLVVVNRTVAFTYGAGDRDARALVMSMERLDSLFGSCAPAEVGDNETSG